VPVEIAMRRPRRNHSPQSFQFWRLPAFGILLFLLLWPPLIKIYFYNPGQISISLLDMLVLCAAVAVAAVLVASPLFLSRTVGTFFLFIALGLALAALVNTYFIGSTLDVLEGRDTGSGQHSGLRLFVVLVCLAGAACLALLHRRMPAIVSGVVQVVWLFVLGYAVLFGAISVWQKEPQESRLFAMLKTEDRTWALSQEQNLLVLSFDQIQGSAALGVLRRHPELVEKFDGFELFEDAASVYPNTIYSLASVLTGKMPRNAADSLASAISGPNFIREALEKGYEASLAIGDEICSVCTAKGPPEFQRDRVFWEFTSLLTIAAEQAYGLSGDIVSSVLSSFTGQNLGRMGLKYVWKLDIDAFRGDIQNIRPSSDKPVVEFRHYFASHQPLMYGRDCTLKRVRDRTQDLSGAEDEVYCVLSSVGLFLDKLREAGLYDRTMIVVISDHGYEAKINALQDAPLAKDFLFPFSATTGPDNIKSAGTYNPTLLFKDFDSHGPLKVNQAPASLLDIAATVCETLQGCSLDVEGVSLRDEPPDRERSYWRYGGGLKDRFTDGKDRLHEGLDEWWEVRSFRGNLAQGLVTSIWPASSRSGNTSARIKAGEVIDFTSGGNSARFKATGWGQAEEWGTWSVSKVARLYMDLGRRPATDLSMTFAARGFVPEGVTMVVDILVNGVEIGAVTYDRAKPQGVDSFTIPVAAAMNDGGWLAIDFRVKDPIAPSELGLSSDTRWLGIGVHRVAIDEVVSE